MNIREHYDHLLQQIGILKSFVWYIISTNLVLEINVSSDLVERSLEKR